MSLDKATVARIAQLARIKVPDGEQDHLARELSNILDWIAQLDEVKTDGVEAMASVVADMRLATREDAVSDGQCRDAILANAPEARSGFFVVPKVVE